MNISLAAKGLDSGDRVLAKSVAERLIKRSLSPERNAERSLGQREVDLSAGAGPGISVVFEAHPRQKMTAVWQKCVARRSLN
jgi:hypothetical protein